ncbi:unnamed protein product [Owenia fusiformis]|uniref:Metalloendopeptidase n=1 Tax=Owenia fusiformis TaxID=6347 RepID=A0A8S4PNQ5_OWEFU|nr:unnamed protein product [Owenia fusiformis]
MRCIQTTIAIVLLMAGDLVFGRIVHNAKEHWSGRTEENTKSKGRDDVTKQDKDVSSEEKNDVLLPSNRVSIEAEQGRFEGDIIKSPYQTGIKKFRNVLHEDFWGNFLWTNGEVPYILDDNYTPTERKHIINAMALIESRSINCVKFKEYSNPTAVFLDGYKFGYLYINRLFDTCLTQYVGFYKIGKQEVYLGQRCFGKEYGIPAHELMHVLGFWHEHNRLDRDDYVVINTNNIRQGKQEQYDKEDGSVIQNLTPYDYYSIMHYGVESNAKSLGLQTITVLDKNIDIDRIGQRTDLTDSDAFEIRCMYGCASCEVINECEMGTDNCHINADCLDTEMSYTCTCQDGFSGDGFSCTNIDECEDGTDNCHKNACCLDTEGDYICTCKDGFSGDGFSCTNIDECKDDTDNCHKNAYCSDTEGNFICSCKDGYSGDGFSCTNINCYG